jgi:hypothetical protein
MLLTSLTGPGINDSFASRAGTMKKGRVSPAFALIMLAAVFSYSLDPMNISRNENIFRKSR